MVTCIRYVLTQGTAMNATLPQAVRTGHRGQGEHPGDSGQGRGNGRDAGRGHRLRHFLSGTIDISFNHYCLLLAQMHALA